MDFLELIFTLLGAAVVVYYGGKLLLFSRMLFPKWCFPLSKTFFTSMGEWAATYRVDEHHSICECMMPNKPRIVLEVTWSRNTRVQNCCRKRLIQLRLVWNPWCSTVSHLCNVKH